MGKNYPQTPTIFALRGDRYKYIEYNGVWDTDELYDMKKDSLEIHNLIKDPKYQTMIKDLSAKLFQKLHDTQGTYIPLNPSSGARAVLRYEYGSPAADFPSYLKKTESEKNVQHK